MNDMNTTPTPVVSSPSSMTNASPAVTSEERNMAMLMYILAIITSFVGPLIIWLMKKDSSPFINQQGKELLNFQITAFIAFVICGVLTIVLIGLLLMPIVGLCSLIFTIMGAIKVSKGEAYRFPFAIRLLT
jgi:uncharacterized Tic20 family protein